MNFKCFCENCTTPPLCFCDCVEDFSFMCPNHIFSHISEKKNLKHTIQLIYSDIDPEIKNVKISQFSELIEFIKNTEASIHSSLSEIIQTLNNMQTEWIKYFREQRLSLQQFIEFIEKEDKEIVVPGYETQKFSFESYTNYLSNMNSDIKLLCQTIKENLDKNDKKIVCYKEFYLHEELDYSGNANLDEHLYCFQTGTKNFIELNTLTLKKKIIRVGVNEDQGSYASICQIPGKKIFYSGGNNPYLDVTYLIDLQTFSVVQLAQIRVRGYATATYFNNHVYIFGGHNSSVQLNNADKFDLANKKWVALGPLPKAAHGINVLPFRTYFLMTLYTNNSLLKYDIDKNSYEALGQNVGMYTALIRNIENIYMISDNILYLSNESNLSEWRHVKSLNQTLTQHTSKPVTRKRNVFLYSSKHNKIWNFNLDSLDLLLIGNIW